MDKSAETFNKLVEQNILRNIDGKMDLNNLNIEWDELSKYISVQVRMY